MRFQCPFCSFIINTEDKYRGRKVECPSCHNKFLLPSSLREEGCIIGDFLIKEKLGEGSIGGVYKAIQISLDRVVALKILSEDYTNTKGITDFLKEARAAATLRHPNLVQSLAVGEEKGICYMAMSYVKGETLKNRIQRDGSIQVDEALHIIQQVAEALFYAWDESGLIHRDVKPDNIMITDDGIVKLTDLGLAMHQADWKEDMEISGSPSYMSPEQFTGEKLDSRSDIYSLGITLYQMLAGTLPFNGETVKTVAKQHFEEDPIALNKLNNKIPLNVANLVKKMIAKTPEERYNNMQELLNRIWTIRQKTAPDKDLVPDVHTISIKRLDYGFQKESKKRKDKTRKKRIRLMKKKASIYRMALLIIAVVLIIITTALVFFFRQIQKEKAIAKRVLSLEKLAKDERFKSDFIAKAANAIEKKYGSGDTDGEKKLILKAQMLILKVKNRELKEKLDFYDKNQTQAENQITELLKKQVETLKKQLTEEKEKNLAHKQNKEDKTKVNLERLVDTREENKKLKKTIADQNSKIKQLEDKLATAWLNAARIKIYKMIKVGKFEEGATLLQNLKKEAPKSCYKWIDNETEWLMRLEKIYADLTESEFKFTGSSIEEFGEVISIKKGKIQYDNYGLLKKIDWSDLPVNSAAALVQPDFPKVTEAQLKADIMILRNKLYKAIKYTPQNKEIALIYDVILKENIKSLKAIVATDPQKASAKASILLKQLSELEGYDKIKQELEKYVIKKEENETENKIYYSN
jgi:hypothetical protein